MRVEQRWAFIDGPLASLNLSATFEVDAAGQWSILLYCAGPADGEKTPYGDDPQWWATYRSIGQRFEDTLLGVEAGEGWIEGEPLMTKPRHR
jgi:hypothetical protein